MYFGSETSEEDAFAILDAFVEAGGSLIDTADVYVGGVSEQIIGGWFAARPRDVTNRVVLASKGRAGAGQDVNAVGLSRRHLHRALNASLGRLGVETIDRSTSISYMPPTCIRRWKKRSRFWTRQ